MPVWQTILLFGLIAIAFDTIWATIARAKGYSYSKGMWVSFLAYTFAGGVAAQSGNIFDGSFTGLGVSGIEATIGWWISWVIGPGRLPVTVSKEAAPRVILRTITIVMLIGACLGVLGAVACRVINS
jgi:hypothetical protein